ncbi:MAG TPA: sigma-70 family RNA polymerase sigma factor [Candidatus Acidoferrum sp.]|jgi:RNA polymerase sigma-70 factor (ECF subfamily)|nr:sigma-70 family RNA polymerase sigma factor [Candidatus Acidoferrum sp.]
MITRRLEPITFNDGQLTPADLEQLKHRLLFKIRRHIGTFCPDALDLVQETLARFLAAVNAGSLRNPERIGPFINGICNNVIHEYRRNLWRQVDYEATAPEERAVAPDAEDAIRAAEVRAVLLKLSARDARLLSDFYLSGKSREEICQEMEVTNDQLRVMLFRAKARFRKAMHQTS